MIQSPVLKYNGGKFRLREWILQYIPDHKVYVEPFFGAGSVFFSKPRASTEIINDMDGLVVNFFKVLRDEPKELIRLIKNTPYSEKVLKEVETIVQANCWSDLKLAWAFYSICWMNIRGNECSSVSFRMKGNIGNFGGHNPARNFAKLAHLIQARDRLRGVTITNQTATDCIETYQGSNTLFYLDPPYLKETRNTATLYNQEMSDLESHKALLEKALNSKGMFVISHYPCELYDTMLNGWERIDKETLSNNMQKGATKKDKARIEALYLSPNVSELVNGARLPF